MMLSFLQWLFQHRHAKSFPIAFPNASLEEQRELDRWVWQSQWLDNSTRNFMIGWSKRFVAMKHWEGCDGFVVTEVVQRGIALNASLLVLAYPDWYFQSTQTILVYPRPYRARVRGGETHSGLAGDFYRAGETRARGPITLNWRDIESSIHRDNDGHHLVLHEFAHQLDMINDPNADGLPPLPQHIESSNWQRDFQSEYRAARESLAMGHEILIDDYGLTHPSEFFAVATEAYFQLPQELREYHPNVYRLLRDFYVTDLAQRLDGP